MSDLIDVGEITRITNGEGFKTKPDGDLFDPVDVELTVRAPSGEVTDLSSAVINDSTGIYHADMEVEESGFHFFRWNGDQVIEQGWFKVEKDRVGEPGS